MALSKKLSFKQLRAIALLLTEPSLDEVARKIGVHEHTLANWRRDPAFQAVYEENAQRVFDSLMTNTWVLINKAFHRLQAEMDNAERSADRIRAAGALIGCAFKSHEIMVLKRELEKFRDFQRLMKQMPGGDGVCGPVDGDLPINNRPEQ